MALQSQESFCFKYTHLLGCLYTHILAFRFVKPIPVYLWLFKYVTSRTLANLGTEPVGQSRTFHSLYRCENYNGLEIGYQRSQSISALIDWGI